MSRPPPQKPLLMEWEEESEADPSLAAPIEDAPSGQAMQEVQALVRVEQRGWSLARLAIWIFGALFAFVLAVTAWDFVSGLLLRDSLLGWMALGLISAAVLVALALAFRELAAYFRLNHLSKLRGEVLSAGHDLARARGALGELTALYQGRAEMGWGLARLSERQAEMFDADALLHLAETELMGPLDQAARREIEAAARQVAMVTALVPLALTDVVTALFANLRMIRRLAELYGGRAGALGSWGLLRRVFTHLLATGAVAIGDDLIGSFAGGGLLSRLSRRFGEGVINGALTARVGLAAMELCRPMPFAALPRPKVTNLVSRAVTGLWGNGTKPEGGET